MFGKGAIRSSRILELRTSNPRVSRAGCSKRLSSKAAASAEARRTLRYVEPVREARTPLAAFFSFLLVDQRRDLDGLLNQAIARIRLEGHRQHAGVDHMYRDNLKAFGDFESFKLHGMTDFQFFPNQII